MDGPFQVEIKVHVTDGKGEQEGTVTYAMPPGHIPTEAEFAPAIQKALDGAIKASPGMRLKTRAEFVQDALGIPVRVAIPGPQDWTPKQYKGWGSV